MALPTSLNSQITDSVTQVNTKVLGDAPAMAMGNLFQATAQALANAAHNATTSQQQTNITAQTATTLGVATLYSIDTASDGVATRVIGQPTPAASPVGTLPQPPPTVALPSAVNSQVTDSVTQVNTKVLGDAPAIAMGNLFQATAQALANAAHNATTPQQQTNITAQAATTLGVATLYSLDTASDGVATKTILQS